MKKFLFVCTGNTCRSPMAEALFRKMTASRDDIEIASAGVQATHGMAASFSGIEVMAAEGADLSSFRSQRVSRDLVEQADFIFGMTQNHCRLLKNLYPKATQKIFLLAEWSDQKDIEDPIGGTTQAYQQCSEKIAAALEKIITIALVN